MEAEQKYLSLSEVAALTPYSSSYLSFLARKGKLRSVKNGDTWFTTREWVLDYMNFISEHPQKNSSQKEKTAASAAPAGYITSAQAERVFPYSSSYFSLRIRQGKLKGEKIGKKWFTTAKWINEYIAEYGEKANSKLLVSSFKSEEPVLPPLPQSTNSETSSNSNLVRRNFLNFSFLQPAAIGLTVITVLILAGPPKFMARWVYEPLAIAYGETVSTIGSISDKISLDNKGQVAGETIKSKK